VQLQLQEVMLERSQDMSEVVRRPNVDSPALGSAAIRRVSRWRIRAREFFSSCPALEVIGGQ
jgi:hypothetical protein